MQRAKGKHLAKRGGKFFPALFRVLGDLVLAAVILTALPLTVPRLLGYEVYAVISGSMEPALPAGSLVYVKDADPASVTPGEIIAFSDDGEVVTHRVMQNRGEEGSFVTRGDANNTDDLFPVPYGNLIGRVKFHMPLLGQLMLYLSSMKGKLAAACAVLGGLLLSILGSSLRDKPVRSEKSRKNIRIILVAVFSLVFLLCAARVLVVKLPYWKGRHVYNSTSQQYTEQAGPSEDGTDADSAENAAAADRYTEKAAADDGGQAGPVLAPIKVDFKALKRVNDDVVGWIYCEGTQINYPVLQGETNDTYIRTLYTGEGHPSGSIFVDAGNQPGFRDNNTIIYGHHMADGAMFGTLEDWREQEYFDAHPCMWLLTPEQDYRVDLFSAYLVDARHDTFTIFRGSGKQFASYLERAVKDSAVKANVETDPEAHYVLLSTCAYTVYDDARTVILGRLVPVDSAGGVPPA